MSQWFEVALPVRAKRKHEEDDEQINFIAWCDKQKNIYDGLGEIFFIPNGSKLAGTQLQRQITGKRLKKMGLRPGVSDLFLPIPRRNYHGLYIEMKSKSGSAEPPQKDFGERMLARGYDFHVCRGCDAAIEIVKAYYQ